MVAPITYDGVDNVAGGSLFRNINFWIAQRVPSRKVWIDHVKNNGGNVVPLEKQADILIADHARKDAPPGSYSWRFIEESVKNGILADKEAHLIGRPLSSSRPVGSSEPTKGTRNPFTQKDDQILTRWVLSQEKMGEFLQGNKIYQTLEEKYPHHTFQSWRDRWVKKLSHLPRPNLPDAEEPAPSPVEAAKPSSRRTPKPGQYQSVASGTRLRFTEQDDKLLLKYVNEAKEAGKSTNGNKIYEALAEEFPHHTWHSWRDRYVRHLSQRDDAEPSESNKTPNRQRASGARQRLPQSNQTPNLRIAAELPSRSPRATPRSSRKSGSPANVDLHEINEKIRIQEELRREKAAVELIQRIWRGYNVRKSLSAPEEQPSGDDQQEGQEDGSEGSLSSDSGPKPPPRTPKAQFYTDLQTYMYYTGTTIPPWPKVGKKSIELWDLFQAAQNFDPQQRDWERVAEALGLDWIEDEGVVEALEKCYEEHLGDFERAMQEFQDPESDDEDSEHQDGSDEQAEPNVSRLGLSPEIEMRSSPPPVLGSKRALELSVDAAYPSNSARKRARRDPSRAVPSTPEEKLAPPEPYRNVAKSSVSGLGRISSPILDSVLESSQNIPPLPLFPKKKVEPETQDFRFDPETQAVAFDDQNDAMDVTPSQQLRTEADFVRPIPFSLPKKAPAASPSRFQEESSLSSMSAKARGKLPARITSPRRTAHHPSRQSPTPTGPTTHTQRPAHRSLPVSFTARKVTSSPSTQPQAKSRSAREAPAAKPTPHSTQHPSRAAATPAASTKATPTASASHRSRNVRDTETPAANDRDQAENDELDAAIEQYMSMKYPENVVIQAIKAATGDPGLVGVVMESIMAGEGVPKNYEGIWTQKDDDLLALVGSVDFEQAPRDNAERQRLRQVGRARRKLVHKHGEERVEQRREVLSWIKDWKSDK